MAGTMNQLKDADVSIASNLKQSGCLKSGLAPMFHIVSLVHEMYKV